MLRILLFVPLFIFARLLAGLCKLLPAFLASPLRRCELWIMYFVASSGPGGFDDAVQTTLMKEREVYGRPIARMLQGASHGSIEEEIGLSLVENVLGPPWLDAQLQELAERHPNAETRRLLKCILAAPR
jgi:hypothetical protein